MQSKSIEEISAISYKSGLEAGREIGRKEILDALEMLHIHHEHGAIVQLDDVEEYLNDQAEKRREAKLSEFAQDWRTSL
jgi:hypothetical protein